MAYGCVGMRPVDMITGPGNAYVAEAKRQLFGLVGIDLPAGPTEILVIADDSADPALVATDLLGQAEHGPDSPAWLITTSEKLGRAVMAEIERQLRDAADRARSPARPGSAGRGGRGRGRRRGDRAERPATRPSISRCRRARNDYYLARLKNYGSLFVGEESTVAYGDKGVGTNHTLPTGRAGALHRRALGRQVPQDRHLSAAHAGGEPAHRADHRPHVRGRRHARARDHRDGARRALRAAPARADASRRARPTISRRQQAPARQRIREERP